PGHRGAASREDLPAVPDARSARPRREHGRGSGAGEEDRRALRRSRLARIPARPGDGAPFHPAARALARPIDGETGIMRITTRPILLVEDDQVDAMTVRRALRELHVLNPLEHVEHGEAGLAWLRDPRHERPCIILLDLNMPVMCGTEF